MCLRIQALLLVSAGYGEIDAADIIGAGHHRLEDLDSPIPKKGESVH